MIGIDAGVSGLVSRRQMKREQGYTERNMQAAQEFEAQQAQIQRDFQEMMANTTHQRAAKDLSAAGLNRILALGSPAPAPAGAMATGKAAAGPHGNPVNTSGLSASALQDAQLKAEQIKQMQEQTNLTKQQARHTSAEADKSEFTRLGYKMANDFLAGKDGDSAKGIIGRAKNFKQTIGELWDDNKELWKSRNESLKQRAHAHRLKRERGGSANMTTIELTKPRGPATN